MRRAPGLPCALLVFAVGSAIPARAWSSPTARLTYIRNSGAERCPDEGELRKAVATRLGYDPFFPWARATVVAEVARRARGFHGHVTILDEHGLALGERSLDATSESCDDMVRALALAISIAIDDLASELAPPPPPPPSGAQPSIPTPPSPKAPAEADASSPRPAVDRAPPPRPARSGERVSWAGWVAPIASFGVAPTGTLGLHLDAELRHGSFSLGLEGRVDLPSSTSAAVGGRVRTQVVLGAVVPCLREPSPLFVCGLLVAGAFSASGVDVAAPQSRSALYAAPGLRLGIELPLSQSLFFIGHADGLVALLRHTVELDQTAVFTLPPAALSMGFGAGARF
jgi:hypothetical protein